MLDGCGASRNYFCMSEQCICGNPGEAIPLNLVRHHTIAAWHGHLEGMEFSFCAEPTCTVVYFSVDGTAILSDAIRRPPAYKTGNGRDHLCFCFDVSGDDVVGDPDPSPYVRERVRKGECACNVLNPSGTCCLGTIGQWKKAH